MEESFITSGLVSALLRLQRCMALFANSLVISTQISLLYRIEETSKYGPCSPFESNFCSCKNSFKFEFLYGLYCKLLPSMKTDATGKVQTVITNF